MHLVRDKIEARQAGFQHSPGDASGPSLHQTPIWPRHAPRFVVYSCCAGGKDGPSSALPDPQDLEGINVLVLGFFGVDGPRYKVEAFFNLTLKARQQYIDALHAHNVSVLLSTFGRADDPQKSKMLSYDPGALGRLHGGIARVAGFDGLDIDWHGFDTSASAKSLDHSAIDWLVRYVNGVRVQLPRGLFALTAALPAPWFASDDMDHATWRDLHRQVGGKIDWYNVQFYTQGSGSYGDCDSLMFKSRALHHTHTSVFELSELANITLDKIVVGKPAQLEGRFRDGYMTPQALAQCVELARKRGWSAGLMGWQYPHANSRWFNEAKGEAFPPLHPPTSGSSPGDLTWVHVDESQPNGTSR